MYNNAFQSSRNGAFFNQSASINFLFLQESMDDDDLVLYVPFHII